MADRIYSLASAIIASGENVTVGQAITIAERIVRLVIQIEEYKSEIEVHHDC